MKRAADHARSLAPLRRTHRPPFGSSCRHSACRRWSTETLRARPATTTFESPLRTTTRSDTTRQSIYAWKTSLCQARAPAFEYAERCEEVMKVATCEDRVASPRTPSRPRVVRLL